jgi:hypothetical protein
MTDPGQSEVAALLQAMLQQQTAMLELQRILVERLLGATGDTPHVQPGGGDAALASSSTALAAAIVTGTPEPPPPLTTPERSPVPERDTVESEDPIDRARKTSKLESPVAESPVVDLNVARGARYYQPRSSPAANVVKPEELELMWRLQEMRDAGDLILQFGPFKGSTLARVAVSNPEYIRQLLRTAQRPEVRAAAGRLVEALDAAAEHKRSTTRGARRGRPAG